MKETLTCCETKHRRTCVVLVLHFISLPFKHFRGFRPSPVRTHTLTLTNKKTYIRVKKALLHAHYYFQ